MTPAGACTRSEYFSLPHPPPKLSRQSLCNSHRWPGDAVGGVKIGTLKDPEALAEAVARGGSTAGHRQSPAIMPRGRSAGHLFTDQADLCAIAGVMNIRICRGQGAVLKPDAPGCRHVCERFRGSASCTISQATETCSCPQAARERPAADKAVSRRQISGDRESVGSAPMAERDQPACGSRARRQNRYHACAVRDRDRVVAVACSVRRGHRPGIRFAGIRFAVAATGMWLLHGPGKGAGSPCRCGKD
jgi:hypothetical protein